MRPLSSDQSKLDKQWHLQQWRQRQQGPLLSTVLGRRMPATVAWKSVDQICGSQAMQASLMWRAATAVL
jgi:hypothetical protein